MCVRVCVVVVVVVVVTKDFCWLLDLKVIKKKRILTFGMDCVGWGAVLDAGGGVSRPNAASAARALPTVRVQICSSPGCLSPQSPPLPQVTSSFFLTPSDYDGQRQALQRNTIPS